MFILVFLLGVSLSALVTFVIAAFLRITWDLAVEGNRFGAAIWMMIILFFGTVIISSIVGYIKKALKR